MFLKLSIIFVFTFLYHQVFTQTELAKLLVVTVATDETDGYKRFKDSLDKFGLDVLVLGMHEEWRGGDMRVGLGGGFKINLLRNGLAKYKDEKNLVLFFTDSYDVVFLSGADEILKKFNKLHAKIVFSAEPTLWPDKSLRDQYPEVDVGKRFLCSGGIIAYADTFLEVINQWDLGNTDDDQLYYTKIYLNSTLRNKFNATLDHTSTLVHNLNFAKNEVEMLEDGDLTRMKNAKYSTYPSVMHGNGPSKIYLNHFANYIPDGWHSNHGCRKCDQDLLSLDGVVEEDLPVIQVAIFVEEPVPFFQQFLDRIASLSYPTSRIHLFVHVTDDYCERILSKFLLRHRSDYASVHVIAPHDFTDQSDARNQAVELCISSKCAYQLSVDGNVQITEADLIKFLISKNKQVIAPIVVREGKLWSNFWGAINADGYYARSDDYLDIVNGERMGIWNVPYVNSIYLTKGDTLVKLKDKVGPVYSYEDMDADMAYCNHLRDEGVFIFADNEKIFGRLLLTDNVKKNQIHPDWWQIKDNPTDWSDKYIHPGFWEVSKKGTNVTQPCPDVYIFPLFTEHGADTVVEIMEDYGRWSNGGNKDDRLSGGYENVPTVDIHMNQIGYEKEWLHLLATYPTQVVEKVFEGYYTKAHSIMMFVVRYKPTEQSFLRPHHDSSTWTMNIALNTHGKDYEGGGCRFLRYDCSVTNIPKGHALIHPGRLTHYHEGLQTTRGTRYIAVSFVDP